MNPAVRKGPFSVEEDNTILSAHAVYGNKWASIAKLLPGRTDNAVRWLGSEQQKTLQEWW